MLDVTMVRRASSLSCGLLGAVLFFVTPEAFAWGDDGHRVVGEIAWRYLTPEARAAVAEALTEPGYETLAEAATWPDTFARRYPVYDPMKPFHYVNVDSTAAQYRRERDCPNGCVVTALAQFMTLLDSRDPPLSLAERRRSIYWLAHFMGDIHQPLHVSHPDGKGGISTVLRFFELPDKRNAHWIWDSGLIERRPPPSPAIAASRESDQPAFRVLTDELVAGLEATDVAQMQRVTAAEAIANEGLLLARRWAFLKTTDHVDEAYAKRSWPIVVQQLKRGGLRLAAVLNRALGQR
jgi:hypothetical protein